MNILLMESFQDKSTCEYIKSDSLEAWHLLIHLCSKYLLNAYIFEILVQHERYKEEKFLLLLSENSRTLICTTKLLVYRLRWRARIEPGVCSTTKLDITDNTQSEWLLFLPYWLANSLIFPLITSAVIEENIGCRGTWRTDQGKVY